jgi:hypothetical protein
MYGTHAEETPELKGGAELLSPLLGDVWVFLNEA